MNAAEISEVVSRACPDWRIDSLRYLAEGDDYAAYVVNDVWVVRVAKHDEARPGLQCEFCLLPRLAERLALRIPSPQRFSFGQSAFIAYPLLPGAALSRERYLRLDPSERDRCAGQVARFLIELHAIELSQAQACGVPVADYVAQCRDLLARARSALYSVLDEPERAWIEQIIGAYLASGDAAAFQPVLLHGDLSPDHVLFEEETRSVSAIIDFGDVMIGDPAWDLVFLYEDYGLDFLARLCRVYDEGAALAARAYRFYLMEAIDWAARALPDERTEALAQLRTLRVKEDTRRRELFHAVGGK